MARLRLYDSLPGLPPLLAASQQRVRRRGGAAPVTGAMIFGQSNANHRGNTTALDPSVNGTVAYPAINFEACDTFSWPPSTFGAGGGVALQPVGAGVTGMGLELSLGRFLIDSGLASSGMPLSKFAIDGSSMANWRNATNFQHFSTDFWPNCESTRPGVITEGIFWQGEADATAPAQSSVYLTELTALMTSIFAAHPNLRHMHIVRLNASATGASITPSDRAAVRLAQETWVANNPGVGFLVDVDGIPLDSADNVHYTANGYWAAGYAIGMSILAANGMTLPTEKSGTLPYVRQLFRPTIQHSSVVGDAAFKVVPTVANVGDWQYIALDANVQANPGITAVDAQGFNKLGLTVDSNAGGAHNILEVWRRQWSGTGGSPVFNTGTGQNRRGALPWTVARGGDADANQDRVSNANSPAMNATAVTTTVNGSLVVCAHSLYSGTDSLLSGITASGLSGVTLIQEARIANSVKFALIAGQDDVAGSSGAVTGTQSVTGNHADKMISIPPA